MQYLTPLLAMATRMYVDIVLSIFGTNFFQSFLILFQLTKLLFLILINNLGFFFRFPLCIFIYCWLTQWKVLFGLFCISFLQGFTDICTRIEKSFDPSRLILLVFVMPFFGDFLIVSHNFWSVLYISEESFSLVFLSELFTHNFFLFISDNPIDSIYWLNLMTTFHFVQGVIE